MKAIIRWFKSTFGVTCPLCGSQGTRVVSGGFPGKMCNEDCMTGWGLAFNLHYYFGWPFTGWMYPYQHPLDYPVALWRWFTSADEEEE